MKKKNDEVEGIVQEALPNTTFKVELLNGESNQVLAYLSGKMKIHRVKVLVGDKVSLVLDDYGVKARIVRRL